jgi:hypothetical protein
MNYKGERARPFAGDDGRFFKVSKVRIGPDGYVSHVLWGEVDAASNHAAGARSEATAAEVVDAIHGGAQVAAVFSPTHRLPERRFLVMEHDDGRKCIAFDGTPSPGRNITDLGRLKDPMEQPPRPPGSLPSPVALTTKPSGLTAAERGSQARRMRTKGRMTIFAVSKVRLDTAGRITAVIWGQVDTAKNDWATPEVEEPVAAVVAALHAGDHVFALFPSLHGHLPDRRFVVADYDGGRKTIVLDGPATHEREVHHMERIV